MRTLREPEDVRLDDQIAPRRVALDEAIAKQTAFHATVYWVARPTVMSAFGGIVRLACFAAETAPMSARHALHTASAAKPQQTPAKPTNRPRHATHCGFWTNSPTPPDASSTICRLFTQKPPHVYPTRT